MEQAKFVLSKKILKEQVTQLEKLNLKISYSYKTNRIVGQVLQNLQESKNVEYSIHALEEIEEIKEKSKIWFFLQAEQEEIVINLLGQGIDKFVVDNEIDLETLLNSIKKTKTSISLGLRMKFQEHRIGTGKYFVYGMNSSKVNELIGNLYKNKYLKEIGVHLHRKSQNLSEWELLEEIKDSLTQDTLKKIKFINLGGGLPAKYVSMNKEVFGYIFLKIKETQIWLEKQGIRTIIEPGRFIAAPCISLIVSIIQKQENNLIVNTTIYNCALDTVLTGTKMLVKEEITENEKGNFFLIKGNSPTRDDIFRYKIKLKDNIKIGDKLTFLNAGAYNYTTDFFGYKKLDTEIKEDF